MPLSAKLKKLRLKKGQSLQDVADAVAVSKAHIWELEKGSATNPGIELLTRLAEHFSVTITFLTDETIEPEEAGAQQFFRDFGGKLSEDQWDLLRSMAGGLTAKKKR